VILHIVMAAEEVAPMPDEPALEFAGLFKHFGENVAVDHIGLRVPPGSFFGLVGPNGAGKTTSLSMAVGLLRPDGGTVRIFGRDVWSDPVGAMALAVVASTVAIAVFGPVVSSRRGRDFGTMAFALVITLLSLASWLVPFVARRLTDGHSPALSAVVRILPSGWGAVAVAVEAASRSDWGLVALALGGLVLLIAVPVLAWPPLLARRLTMSVRGGGRSRTRHAGSAHVPRRQLLPPTPLGAVIGKELRLYSRSVLRSLLLMISFLVGVLVCVIPAFTGNTDPGLHRDQRSAEVLARGARRGDLRRGDLRRGDLRGVTCAG
jgi:energy-coupling factor transporter ATP-binding protein EcfA2